MIANLGKYKNLNKAINDVDDDKLYDFANYILDINEQQKVIKKEKQQQKKKMRKLNKSKRKIKQNKK
jgi:hypothetical protein